MAGRLGDGLCLNVGCGLTVGPSWLNVDGSVSLRLVRLPLLGAALSRRGRVPAWPAAVVRGDIVRGLSLRSGSCRLVFASHLLEHLSLADVRRALANCATYLAPGGWLRCIVPDLEDHARAYLDEIGSADVAVAREAGPRFLEGTDLGLRGSRLGFRRRLGEALSGSRHQWMWDRPSLAHALEAAGLRDVAFRKYGDWADERFREVEEESRHVRSLCAEARKPPA